MKLRERSFERSLALRCHYHYLKVFDQKTLWPHFLKFFGLEMSLLFTCLLWLNWFNLIKVRWPRHVIIIFTWRSLTKRLHDHIKFCKGQNSVFIFINKSNQNLILFYFVHRTISNHNLWGLSSFFTG